MQVLIVEDDVFFCSVIKDAIESCGFEWSVHVASTGMEAMALLAERSHHFGVVFVDLGLPDTDGCSVIRASQAACPDARVLVVSSSAAERRLLAALRAGASGYIVKGDAHISVGLAIRQLMAGIYPISPQLSGCLLKRVVGMGPGVDDELVADTSPLTPREKELLLRFSEGATYAEAADSMSISVKTAQTHARNVYRKLGVHSCLQALSKARNQGILS